MLFTISERAHLQLRRAGGQDEPHAVLILGPQAAQLLPQPARRHLWLGCQVAVAHLVRCPTDCLHQFSLGHQIGWPVLDHRALDLITGRQRRADHARLGVGHGWVDRVVLAHIPTLEPPI